MQQCLHGAQRQCQHRRDLIAGAVLQIEQRDDLLLLVRQCADGLPEPAGRNFTNTGRIVRAVFRVIAYSQVEKRARSS